MQERLQKILSQAGVASRRKAEEMIVQGRVSVNGAVVMEMGTKADLASDHIKVDGKLIRPPKGFLYLALNKPDGYVTTMHDPEGRPTVVSLIRGLKDRVYPVGRLDYHSEGLLLLTNDGEFANRALSAHTELVKTYLVKSNGPLTPEQEEQFRNGVSIGGKRTAPAGLRLFKRQDNPWYEVKLIEGRNNQIRLMFKHFGRLVEKLRRTKIGFLELGEMKPGDWRSLNPREVDRFRRTLRLNKVVATTHDA